MNESDDENQPIQYGITPFAFIVGGWWLIPALTVFLIPIIFRLMKWLLE